MCDNFVTVAIAGEGTHFDPATTLDALDAFDDHQSVTDRSYTRSSLTCASNHSNRLVQRNE